MDAVGYAGMLSVLGSYVALRKYESRDLSDALSVLGGLLLLAYAVHLQAVPNALLNVTWVLITLWSRRNLTGAS